ncbi:serine/arginine repetitive matrix protein 4 [Drosophila pseudoobscura]|uniref:Serine/arginine repetitive matrix protein 4 n=1 Tax=Drosophila pseudoobscura pseudoobscura TaxID=46245 RepID=A0A6I8UCV9_DROPS|nr:serine/arginine repetitive matrix protein 4 [Drosophila pseudoobscura]
MGDGDDLTSQAIAELIREIEGGDARSSSGVQERKVNPLGKPNKRFLGRTINTALRHNQRESERMQAECQRKLKDLDKRYEKRKSNYYYNRDAGRYRSRSSSRSRSRSRSRKVEKRRSSSRRRRSSSSRSPSYSRSRKSSHKKRKHQSKHKRKKKTKHKRRARSSSSRSSSPEEKPVPTVTELSSSELFFYQSRQVALAMAMSYGQGANGPQVNGRKIKERASSSLSDIARELMSDNEHGNVDSRLINSLSISSSENGQELLTIDVSSSSGKEEESSAESRGTEISNAENGAGCFIALDDSTTESESGHNSDIEIIEECQVEQNQEPERRQQQVDDSRSAIDSVDLTED